MLRRLYMLMDCITTGTMEGRSLASFIERDPVAILGNTLVRQPGPRCVRCHASAVNRASQRCNVLVAVSFPLQGTHGCRCQRVDAQK